MTNAAYFTILVYGSLAGFLLITIIYWFHKDIKYWWLRNFTKTYTVSHTNCSIGGIEFIHTHSPKHKSGYYIYLGNNKFRLIKLPMFP